MVGHLKEPVNGLTHLVGAVLSVGGLALLIHKALTDGTVWQVVSFGIFGASLILLYTSSAIYHLLACSERATRALRRMDHMMIFVLITGTYAPICLVALRGAWGWGLLSGVLVIAAGGIVMKSVWMDAPRWLSTLVYVILGSLVAVAFYPLSKVLLPGGIWWLAIGGASYIVGALVYGLKWPNFSRNFGFHELWHLFVMGGSLSHFWFVFQYVSQVR